MQKILVFFNTIFIKVETYFVDTTSRPRCKRVNARDARHEKCYAGSGGKWVVH